MLVVSNVEVKDSAASAAGELFCDMFCKGRNARMLDCYHVERFETMNEVKICRVLFDNTEPMRTVRGIDRSYTPASIFTQIILQTSL